MLSIRNLRKIRNLNFRFYLESIDEVRYDRCKTLLPLERLMECFEMGKMLKDMASQFTKHPDSLSPNQLDNLLKQSGLVTEGPVREVIKILEEGGFHPVIGGSIAAMSYSEGRATKDCDINIIASVSEFNKLYSLIQQPGFVTTRDSPLKGRVNGVPIMSFFFEYKKVKFDIFFNDNFATKYAIENARTVGDVRVIPPESVCFFKFANINEGSSRYLKDANDSTTVLKYATEEEFESINAYVLQSLQTVWGSSDSSQAKLWKHWIEIIRSERKKFNRE